MVVLHYKATIKELVSKFVLRTKILVDEASSEQKVVIQPGHLQMSVTIYGKDYKLKTELEEEDAEEEESEE